MKVKKLTIGIKNIPSINPITKKFINRGYKGEIVAKYDKTKELDYKLDTTKNTVAGDINIGNYLYQVKAKNCCIKLIKEINEKASNINELIDIYLKYSKANRYIYVIEYNNETYTITMNKQEFKKFILAFGYYSKVKNQIRVFRSDNVIYNWATA